MYNTREALAYSGKLPEQQNQAAITPQLLDLLALQKVEADKKAAAQQLAMASGQAQPTVAQGLQQRAMQSARQEITQKMGLAGLEQSGPPAGPMPQPQGLMGAPTNLPTQYRGGGIIAFAQGGSGGDAHGRYRQQDEEAVDGEDRPPQMSPEKVAFGERQLAAVEKLRDQDPDAEQRKAMEFQQNMLSPARDAAIARKREQQAGLKALYERQIAERPSNFQVALDRMAQNIREPGGLGGAFQGISPAVQAAREGYTKQEIVQLNSLSAIDDEIDKAIQDNDVSKYNAGVARRKEVEAQMKSGLEAGTTMADVNEKVTAGLQRNYETVQGRKQAAATLAEQRAQGIAIADATRRAGLEQAAATKYAAIQNRASAAKIASLDRKAKMELDAKERAIKIVYGDQMNMGKSDAEKLAQADQIAAGMLGKASAAPGGGDIASLAAQELARRQGQRRPLTGGR